jgi:hypothetical protein
LLPAPRVTGENLTNPPNTERQQQKDGIDRPQLKEVPRPDRLLKRGKPEPSSDEEDEPR